MERFRKTSQTLQNSKMALNRATNLLQGLHDFIQLLRPQFQKFEGRGQVLSGCYHYTEEISRKKRIKVRLDSEGESEDTSLDPSSRFFLLSFFYLPYLSSIDEKANCISIFWTGRPHSLGSCHFRSVWATCRPHKAEASR